MRNCILNSSMDENKAQLTSTGQPITSTVIIDYNDEEFFEGLNNAEASWWCKSEKRSNEHPAINICLDTDLSESEIASLNEISNSAFCKAPWLADSYTGGERIQCPFEQCKKSFIDPLQLQKHYRNHQERRHKCQYCSQKFLYLKDKKIHERIHTGERPYQCHQCRKSFTQKNTLANHIISHKKGTKEETCHVCGRSYYYKKTLAHHIREKHPNHLGDDYLVCSKCGKKYSGVCRYKCHVANCKGRKVKSFESKVCNVSIVDTETQMQSHNLENLSIDRKTQSQPQQLLGLRPHLFQCGVCEGVVQSEPDLRSHMQRHHKIGYDRCIQVQVLSGHESTGAGQSLARFSISNEVTFVSEAITLNELNEHGS